MALGQPVDFQAILKRAGERFVDEQRLAGLDHVGGVLEVRAAVDVLDHHRVDVPAHLGHGGIKFYAPFTGQLGSVFFDARVARLDVRTAVLDCGDDLAAGDVVFGRLVVEDACEGGDVRGVQPDHSDAEVFSLNGESQRTGEKCRDPS